MENSATRRSKPRRKNKMSEDTIHSLLSPVSTTPERLRGLLEVGLPPTEIAKSVGVSPSTLRNWSAGQAEPRPNAAITLDDLRATTLTLLEGGLEPKRAVQWLTSRQSGGLGERPVDILSFRPTQVLSAATEQVLDRVGHR